MPDNKEPKADFSDVEGGSSSTAPPAARTHTVVKGDTLSKLAKQYYGSAGQWKPSTKPTRTPSRIPTSSIPARPSRSLRPDRSRSDIMIRTRRMGWAAALSVAVFGFPSC